MEEQPLSKSQEQMLVGTVFDEHLEIVALLGSGGMGSVYKALDLKLDRQVAVKVINAQATSPSLMARFRQEMIASARLAHPNIVKVFATGEFEGNPYLVMEILEGRTLDAILDERLLDRGQFLVVFREVLEGLAHAHSQGILHRDIKPGNIMLTLDNASGSKRVKILDFGIAKVMEQDQKLTQTGAIIGSVPYMSPEQSTNSTLDARSDLYSVACVMVHALTGQPPFVGDSALDVMYKHMHEEFRAGEKLLSAGSDIAAVVTRCLAKSPDARFKSAAQMSDALKVLTADAVPEPPPTSTARNMRVLLPLVLLIAACAGAGFWFWRSGLNSHEPMLHYSTVLKLAEHHAYLAGDADADASKFRNLGKLAVAQQKSLYAVEEWDKCRDEYKRWLSTNPAAGSFEEVNARLGIAATYIAQKQAAKGLALIEKLLPYEKQDLNLLTINSILGNHYFSQSEYDKAKPFLERVEQYWGQHPAPKDERYKRRFDSHVAQSLQDLGAIYHSRGDLVAAARCLESSCELWSQVDPGHECYYDNLRVELIQIFQKQKNSVEVEKQFLKRIHEAEFFKAEIADRYRLLARARTEYAQWLVSEKQISKAKEQLRHCEELEPLAPLEELQLQRTRAFVAAAEKDTAGIKRYMRAADAEVEKLALPERAIHFRVNAEMLSLSGPALEAETIAAYQRAVRQGVEAHVEQGALALAGLGNIYLKKGKTAEALALLQEFEKAIESKPREALALTIMGEHRAPFDRAGALRLWNKAEERLSRSPFAGTKEFVICAARIQCDLASYYRDEKDMDRALKYSARGLELLKSANVRDDTFVAASLFRARLLAGQGNVHAALDELDEARKWSSTAGDSLAELEKYRASLTGKPG